MLRELKKAMMAGRADIYISKHAIKRMKQRGYTKADLVAGIFTGQVIERQGANVVLISGKDKDSNPIVLVIDRKSPHRFKIVTVMPPIDKERFPVTV